MEQAIQFIEEMEQQIEINKLKKNIQGFVPDVDNRINEENEASENGEFDTLIDKTFELIFSESNLKESSMCGVQRRLWPRFPALRSSRQRTDLVVGREERRVAKREI